MFCDQSSIAVSVTPIQNWNFRKYEFWIWFEQLNLNSVVPSMANEIIQK